MVPPLMDDKVSKPKFFSQFPWALANYRRDSVERGGARLLKKVAPPLVRLIDTSSTTLHFLPF